MKPRCGEKKPKKKQPKHCDEMLVILFYLFIFPSWLQPHSWLKSDLEQTWPLTVLSSWLDHILCSQISPFFSKPNDVRPFEICGSLDLLVYSLDCVILSLALLIFLLRFIYTLCKYSHYQKSNINTLPLFWMVVFG